jgi:methionyl-tRNA formyltransferase
MPLDLVFCGTPLFAVPTLEKLVGSGFRVHLVVTQPDRPKGRGLELVASPVKQCALALGLPLSQPERIKANDDFRAQLNSIKPDAIIVVGYGRIIPQWMLDLPPLGNINLHASLLPKFRGAAPIQWAIASGETVTGVTTMRIDAGLDTGDILLQRELPISPDDTSLTIAPVLAEIGAGLVVETMRGLKKSAILPRPQDNSQSSLAPILKKEDGLVDFSRTANEIVNRMRGFQPWPGAYTKFRGKVLQILSARAIMADKPMSAPGLAVENGRLLVACAGHSMLELLEIQLEGKRRTTAHDFIQGYRPKEGERLE